MIAQFMGFNNCRLRVQFRDSDIGEIAGRARDYK